MSASEKKIYKVKFDVERTYTVEVNFEAPDQETADQMACDMRDNPDELLDELIRNNDSYDVGEADTWAEPQEHDYTPVIDRKVASWCETWEEQQAEDEDEDEEEEDEEEAASE
jgi:hypothetical protein